MNFFNAAEINNFLSFVAIKNGYHLGGEVDFRFTRDLAMVVRVEEMVKSVVGWDSVSDEVFQIDATAIPIMVGLEVTLTDESNFSSFFGVMAGVALNTTLKSQLIQGTGGTTQFLSQNFTGIGRFIAAYHVTKMTHLYAEVGYRYLRTQPQIPSSEGTGKEIWQKSNAYVPLTLDMSGVTLSLGLALHL
jgi:hypothetical protein